MTKEQKFFKALQDVFIGAKIEGQGGFINLMRIKSNYYSQIEKILKNDIDEALKKHPKFRDELFDKLYSFFSRYFSESGSIYFSSTPFHNNIYEKVYTDDRDVVLFWKTQMLYYVKTDRIFRSMPIEFSAEGRSAPGGDLKFYFDASTIETKKANEKRSLIFELSEGSFGKEIKEDRTIHFSVYYSEKGRKTKTDDILKALKKNGIKITEDDLERAFRIFEKQSEVDFFINKNARAFLQEQFKLWSYQYFWEGSSKWSAERVNELQVLKDIAFKIIDFISQFEDELVKIWNKPKFVKNSNYVITLDRLLSVCNSPESGNPLDLIKKLFDHKNINQQIKEWKELGFVDEKFNIKHLLKDDIFPKDVIFAKKEYQFLPIDTKYFKDLEPEILSLFDNLDEAINGWLIKSENYQALNTILPKFKEKVQTIYIDPPFNLDSSDQFLYRTNYKDANWATLLENRLRIAKNWLNEKGSIFVRCDYNGNWIVRLLLDEIVNKENFLHQITINRRKFEMLGGKTFSNRNENLMFYSKNSERIFFNKIRIRNENPDWKPLLHLPGKREKPERFIGDKKVFPPNGRHFGISQASLDIAYKEGRVRFNEKGNPEIFVDTKELNDNWTDIDGYSFGWEFSTENAEILLKRVIEISSDINYIVLDFFLGSGTTTAVAHKLGRKWIGVEMGEHFFTVVLPRMKKVLFYDKSGISKEKDVKENYNEKNAGGFFKYYELEQYEEALARCKYEDSDLFTVPNRSPYQEYVFLKDEKLLDAMEIDYKNKKVNIDLNKLYDNIDVAETLSNLTGKWIKQVKSHPDKVGTKIKSVVFEDGSEIDLENLDYKIIKPLIWWE